MKRTKSCKLREERRTKESAVDFVLDGLLALLAKRFQPISGLPFTLVRCKINDSILFTSIFKNDHDGRFIKTYNFAPLSVNKSFILDDNSIRYVTTVNDEMNPYRV